MEIAVAGIMCISKIVVALIVCATLIVIFKSDKEG